MVSSVCGRFVSIASPRRLAEWLSAEIAADLDGLSERYNVAPSSEILAVATPGGDRRLGLYRWGLIPAWADDPAIGSRMINARAETVAEKRSFSGLLRSSRCVVPMDGFYEWAPARGSSGKTPSLIRRVDREPFGVAGLWTTWRDRRDPDRQIASVTVLTCAANRVIEPIHHRMPVILDEDGIDVWLDPDRSDPLELAAVLVAGSGDALEVIGVSRAVNNARNEGPQLIEPVVE